MEKTLATLVKDIEAVVDGEGGWDATLSRLLGEDISGILDARVGVKENREPTLRMSNLGTPCRRKLWYSLHKSTESEPLRPNERLKFLYGDLLEAVLIRLCEAAGHRVEGLQSELEIGGIKGHRDCVIDGVTVDIKSASPFGFQKFVKGDLRSDDPFGYISQLSSYVYAGRNEDIVTEPNRGAFLVIDKVHGHICLDEYDFTFETIGKEEEVEEIKTQMAQESPPTRGFEPVPEGKSGNKKLPTVCSYCSFKKVCHPSLRTFIYSRGPVFLTDVKKIPKVPEVT